MDAIILSSPPSASPFAAAGRAPRNRGCIAVAIGALLAAIAGLGATLHWSYSRAPLPSGSLLLAALPPGTRLPENAPADWRYAVRAFRPSIVGYAIGMDGAPRPFALQMQAPWGVPGNRTGWHALGENGGAPTPTELGPLFSLSRWRDAWLRIDFGDERLQGPLKNGTWTLDAPMTEGYAPLGSAFQYTAPLAIPGATDALKEIGIFIPSESGRVSWSIGHDGTLSALKIETENALTTSTAASILSAIPDNESTSTRTTIATTSHSITWNDPGSLPTVPETCPGKIVARLPVSALDSWIPWRPQGTTLSIASNLAGTSFCWE